MRTPRSGFTLVELCVALAIVAVLALLAIPSFSRLLESARLDTVFHTATASLATARLASVTRQVPVAVCPSQDGRQCRRDLAWEDGWIVFLDPNHNRELDGDEAPLSVGQTLAEGVAVVGSNSRLRIDYQPDGSARGTNATLTVCDRTGGAAEARTLVISQSGRVRFGSATAENATACMNAAFPPL